MKFLVTGANGDIGEAIGRIIRENWPGASLHGADLGDPWPASELFDRVHGLPRGDDAGFGAALNRLARDIGADCVIPVPEPELRHLAEIRGPADDLPLLMLRSDLVSTMLDKLQTARWLARHGLPAPRTVPLAEAIDGDLPVFVKQARGHGARNTEIVRSPARLAVAKAEAPADAIAQELLEPADREYTCAVFRSGDTLRTLAMRRLLEGGTTMRIVIERHPAVDEILAAIATAADLQGSLNVQIRLTRKGPRVFEINPRFSGTVMMRHRIGFCDLVWSIGAREGRPPPGFEPPLGARVFRLAREVVAPPASSHRKGTT